MKRLKSNIYYDAMHLSSMMNSKVWRNMMHGIIDYDRKHGTQRYLEPDLHGNNKERFKQLWGRQSFCWDGSCRNWIWVHELEHGNLYVLCSVRGTSYEVSMSDSDDFELCCEEAMQFINDEIICTS